jgi:hypothetical protein
MKIQALAVVLAALGSAGLALGKEYKIQLDRTPKQGDHYEIKIEASQSQHIVIESGAQVVQDKKRELSGSLEGMATAVDVGDDGIVRETKIKVSKCVAKRGDDAAEKEILPAGTELVMKGSTKENEFFADGKKVSDDVKEVLGMLLEESEDNGKDDDIFGSDKPRKPGDHWSIDAKKAAKSLSENAAKVEAENISGEMVFEKVVEKEGVECLVLHGHLKMKDAQAPMPPGIKIESGVFSGTFNGIFPADPKIQPLLAGQEMTGKITAKGQTGNGVPLKLTMKIRQKKVVETKPAK